MYKGELFFNSVFRALIILFAVSVTMARDVRPLNNNWEFMKTDFDQDFDNPDHSWQKD